jgi:hypothetical protein
MRPNFAAKAQPSSKTRAAIPPYQAVQDWPPLAPAG